ncbi:MAG TPA: hypothetical protein VF412_13980 [Bdellovibrio sp.]|uniref:hypothetical protein n=1 Tax=Bdellovibrio sp. TaxID=28201 RepID=UPI002EDDA76A
MKRQSQLIVGAALVLSTVWSSMTFASEIDKSGNTRAATSKAEFCKNADDPNYFKSLLYNENNHLASLNHGGIANGGVCWWHSMFSRSATFLAVYRPDLPRPSADQAHNIIEDISTNKGIVEIPGYRNLAEFSQDYADDIQRTLEGMQIGDGVIMFGWVRGLSGDSEVSADKLKSMMDDLYKEVRVNNRIVYQKLQIPGITAHAWLVVDMKKSSDGYVLEVLDSNYGSIYQVNYHIGMTKFESNYNMVPYTSRNGMDYSAFAAAKKQYCKYGMTAEDIRERQSGSAGH